MPDVLQTCLFQSPLYIPRSEYEVQNGFTDIFLKRHPRQPTIKYEWLWELKYIKEGDRKSLPAVREKAREQLMRYQSDREMTGRDDLKTAAVIFIGKKEYEIIY
jgi:hypothetical protein